MALDSFDYIIDPATITKDDIILYIKCICDLYNAREEEYTESAKNNLAEGRPDRALDDLKYVSSCSNNSFEFSRILDWIETGFGDCTFRCSFNKKKAELKASVEQSRDSGRT